jgi:hypothetical protein
VTDDAELKRRGPLQSTGYKGSTFTEDRMAIGPCEHVNAELIHVFQEAVALLWAAVSAARTLPNPEDPKQNALQQILVASCAIAASEAEALITLCSVDLCAPARIHARALGGIAQRLLLLPKHPDVALEMYSSLEASRKELVKKVPANHPARKLLEAFFAETGSATMEKIERSAYDKDELDDSVFFSSYESKALSKWNHADIVALADTGDRLLAAGTRVRTAVVVDPEADLMIHRAQGNVLAILYAMETFFRVEIHDRLDELMRRHAQFVDRFRAANEAMRERLAEVEALKTTGSSSGAATAG